MKSESSSKHKTKLCTKLNKMFTYMDGINYPVLVSPPLLTRAYNYKWMGWMDGWMGWLSLGLAIYRAPYGANNVPKYLMCKYTNTVLVKVTDMPNICYIFAKVMVHGSQKQCSRVSDVQIHKYKNTNTQIHFFQSCRYV